MQAANAYKALHKEENENIKKKDAAKKLAN
jgi:hypothetical protein